MRAGMNLRLALIVALFSIVGCSGPSIESDTESDARSNADGSEAQNNSSTASDTNRPPNILLIISDDVGLDVTTNMYPGLIESLVDTYGPSGRNHPEYNAIAGRPASTPTLDRLAQQGMVFTNVWAHPFCSPTRASLLTGLFGAETKVLSYADPLTQNHTSFVQMLKDEAGYSTGLFGKWHLAGLPGAQISYPGMKPKEAGFEIFQGNMHAAIGTFWQYDYEVQDANTPAGEWLTQTPPERSLPGIAATTYAPVVKAADTIDWIAAQESANPDKPWFAWLAFNLSHATIQRAPSQMAVPNADTLDDRSRQEMEACGGQFGTQETGECSGESLMRAMTNSLDTVMGKVLDAVDQIDPNTFIIYIGDNGTPMYGRPNLDFIDNMYISKTGRGKGTSYESGARVAMAVRGPGIAENSRSEQFTHAVDLFATTLEIAGLTAPKYVRNSDGSGTVPLDAVSLAPILFADTDVVRDPNDGYVLTESLNLMTGGTRQVGARNAEFKLICTDSSAIADCEFYNLFDDPLEEYPLQKPDTCSAYGSGRLNPADVEWHFCRLTQVIDAHSFL